MNDQVFGVHCSNGFCEFDSHSTTKIYKNITMFKVNKKDIFAKNMSNQELHEVWQKLKAKQEMDEWFDQLEEKYNEEKQDKYY